MMRSAASSITNTAFTLVSVRAPLDGPQQHFLNAVRVFRTTGSDKSPADLAPGVMNV